MTYRCDHAIRFDDSGVVPDSSHRDTCNECRELVTIDQFFAVLDDADELSPSLPNPKLILLQAELVRQRQASDVDSAAARWTGVGLWSVIALTWIAVLAFNVERLAGALVPFGITLAAPTPAVWVLAFVVGIGGCAIFATAIHTVLTEM